MQYDDSSGEVIGTIEIEAHHYNPTGNINNSVLITLADNLSTGAANIASVSRFGLEHAADHHLVHRLRSVCFH